MFPFAGSLVPSTSAMVMPTTALAPLPAPKTKPRFRVVTGWANGKIVYYPQYRGWFLWHNFKRSEDSEAGSYRVDVRYDTIEGAKDHIKQEKADKPYVPKVGVVVHEEE